MNQKHPVQPLYEDEYGVLRFKPNAIVKFLLDQGPHDMNTLALKEEKFSREDEEQFAQLIGYSLGGWSGLDYVSDETYHRAEQQINNRENKRDGSLFVRNVKRIFQLIWEDNPSPIIRCIFLVFSLHIVTMVLVWEGLHFLGATQREMGADPQKEPTR